MNKHQRLFSVIPPLDCSEANLNLNVGLSICRVNWRRLFNHSNYIYLHKHHPCGHDFVSSNYRTIISAKIMHQRMYFRIMACTDYIEVLIRQKALPVH